MFKKMIVANALMVAAFGAQAGLIGGVAANQSPSSFIDLSVSGVVTGGALYTANALPSAAIPLNLDPLTQTVGTWLGVGPDNNNNGGGEATVTFAPSTTFVSFLWGSPDTYNTVTVIGTFGSLAFDSASFPSIVFNGNQNFASYIGFTTDGGDTISSLRFSSGSNAFEVANFSTTAPIPEPSTYALMLAGLAAVGFVAKRRRVTGDPQTA